MQLCTRHQALRLATVWESQRGMFYSFVVATCCSLYFSGRCHYLYQEDVAGQR